MRRAEERIAHTCRLSHDALATLVEAIRAMKAADLAQASLLERLSKRNVVYLASLSVPSNASTMVLTGISERARCLSSVLDAVREYNAVVRGIENYYRKNEGHLDPPVPGFITRDQLPREIRDLTQ